MPNFRRSVAVPQGCGRTCRVGWPKCWRRNRSGSPHELSPLICLTSLSARIVKRCEEVRVGRVQSSRVRTYQWRRDTIVSAARDRGVEIQVMNNNVLLVRSIENSNCQVSFIEVPPPFVRKSPRARARVRWRTLREPPHTLAATLRRVRRFALDAGD